MAAEHPMNFFFSQICSQYTADRVIIMAADNNGYSSKESWKRSGAGKSPGDKLEGEGGSSGQPACATAAVGYKPEPLPPETLTYHLSPALNDLPNNSA